MEFSQLYVSRIAASLLIFLGQVYTIVVSSQVVLVVKNLPATAGNVMRGKFSFWVRKIPWRRA